MDDDVGSVDSLRPVLDAVAASEFEVGTARSEMDFPATPTSTTGVPLARGLTPTYNLSYHNATSRVFRMLAALTKQRLPGTAFATGMTYFHLYCDRRRNDPFDPTVLGVACLFLACKAENITGSAAGLKRMIPAVWDLGSAQAGYQQRVDQVLVMEMMVSHTLGFSFHFNHPQKRAEELLRIIGADRGNAVHTITHRFLNYTLHTPLCTVAEPTEVAEAVVTYVAHNFDDGAAAAFSLVNLSLQSPREQAPAPMLKLLAEHVTTSRERLAAIHGTLFQFLVYAGKDDTGLRGSDDRVRRALQLRRNKTPTPQRLQ